MNEDAKRLGAAAAARIDVERIVAGVLKGLREEPVRRPGWLQPAWLRVAAVLVVLVGGGLFVRELRSPRIPHGAHYVTDDLTDLNADQLRDVLSTLDETLNLESTTLPDGDLEYLDAQQLQAVLRSLEG